MIFQNFSKILSKNVKKMKKTKNFFRDRPARQQRSPDALHSRMRLAKGFFLPVFVAQIGDFKLPCTIGRASAGHRAGIGRRFSRSFFRRNNNFLYLFQLYKVKQEKKEGETDEREKEENTEKDIINICDELLTNF